MRLAKWIFLRIFLAIAPCTLVLHVGAAVAQSRDDAAPLITASWATTYARYYAPYALQAAAAYLSVPTFDATREAHEQPALDGADVDFAVSPYSSEKEIAERAKKFLRAWQYQFGSDRYLRCFDEADTYCQQQLGWTLPIGGGPAFQVWARTRYPHRKHDACSEVSIAFRGTTGFVPDWITNADVVTHYFADDYYVQLQRNVDAVIRKITQLDCYKRARQKPQIVSVGHSLGGGLAQFAALANKPTDPRIAKVFAFNSSPFTGASLIERTTLSNNAAQLEIDRIYQSGEVLENIRKVSDKLELRSTFPRSSSPCRPRVRTVRFDAFEAPNSIGLHGMATLAAQTVQLSYNRQTQLEFVVPPKAKNCRTRYSPPDTDEDQTPLPSVNSGEIAYAPDGSVKTTHNKNPHRRFAANFSAKRTLKSNPVRAQTSR